MLGYASTMDGPLSDPWYDPNASMKYELSVAKAEELLNRAGYPKKADGTRFKLVISLESTRFSTPRTAEVIKESLKQVGIDVEIKGERRDAQQRMFVSYTTTGPALEFAHGPDPAAVSALLPIDRDRRGYLHNGRVTANLSSTSSSTCANEPDVAKRN